MFNSLPANAGTLRFDAYRNKLNKRTASKIGMFATSLPLLPPIFSLLLSLCASSSSAASVTITFDLLEESPPSTPVGNLSSETKILGLFRYAPSASSTPPRYSLLSEEPTGHQGLFTLTEDGGLLSTRERIDREQLCPLEPDATCEIELDVAIQAGSRFNTVKVVVRVVDLNDHSPRFVKGHVQLTISEAEVPGTEFFIPEAEDPDSGIFGIRNFELVAEDPPGTNGTFRLRVERTVDGTTELRLVLARSLDREKVDRYRMRVLARDGGNPVSSGTLLVEIVVQDVNDNPPQFVEPVLDVSIEENLPNGTIIGVVKALDRDSGSNGVVTFAFTRSTQLAVAGLFNVGADSGEIRVVGSVDYERRRRYSLGVAASDRGSNPLSSYAVLTVHVTDVNDNAPRISVNPLTHSGHPEVRENSGPGTFAAHVSVKDPDTGSGGEWNCSLAGFPGFRLERIPEVNQNEFKLVTSVIFDRELEQLYHVTLTCADRGLPALTSSAEVEVRVLDENDEAPQFKLPVYSALVVENNRVGEFIAEVTAFDRDLAANGEISYAISYGEKYSGVLPVTIDSKLGRIYANVALDREERASYEFLIIASDAGLPVRSASVSFRLNVTDVNDEPPMFSHRMFTFGTYENQPSGTEVGTVTAVDSDAPPNDVIHYEIVGSSGDTFRIDSATGRITSLKPLDREDVSLYLMNVTARNPGTSLQGETQVKVIVADRNDNTPVIRYPAGTNSSVQISSRARIGDIIATIDASDDDVGSNEALRYAIAAGSDAASGLFAVNQLSGVITVRRDLGNHADRSFPLQLLVHDEGQPRRSASASLLVTINSTLEVAWSSGGQRGPIPISALTLIAAAVGAACIVVMVAVILLLVLRRRRRGPEVVAAKPEGDKMLPLAESHGAVVMRNESHPDAKSNLLQYNADSKPLRNEKTVDSKNKKNSNKNKKNWNKNKKNLGKNEDELSGKKIAWLASYEDNLLQTYKPKNNMMADACSAATSPSPSNRVLPPPPPPPRASSHPPGYLKRSEEGANEERFRGLSLGTSTPHQAPQPTADARHPVPCGCCSSRQIHRVTQTPSSQSPDGSCLAGAPLTDRASDQGSVTDSGRGQSEDGELLTSVNPSLRQVRHFPFPGDHPLATYAISPVGWTARPTCVSSACHCEHTEQQRLSYNRAPPEQHRLVSHRPQTDVTASSDLHRLGSRLPTRNYIAAPIAVGNTLSGSTIRSKCTSGGSTLTGTVPIGAGSVHAATGSGGHVTRNGRKEEEEEGYLSDDATTTSGSYVLESKNSNIWRKHPCTSDTSCV